MNDVNFDPINRLVEFGLGVSIAQQMVQIMNSTIQNMNVPGQSIPINISKEWYIVKDGNPSGPLMDNDIKKLLLNKSLVKEDLIWSTGMQSWMPIKDVPEILRMIIQLPPKL